MSGFEAYREDGVIQFMSTKGTLPLYQKQNKTVDTSGVYNMNTTYLPYELGPDKTPIIAVCPPSNSEGMLKGHEWLWNDLEASMAGNRGGAMYSFPPAYNVAGTPYETFIFSNNRNLNNSTFGFQYFDESGTLVYDMQDKPFRVADVFEPAWTGSNTSWTYTRNLPAGRKYAVVQNNANVATYHTWGGDRYYDPTNRVWIYIFQTYVYYQYWKINQSTGTFTAFNSGGRDVDEEYEGDAEDNPPPDFWSVIDNGQRYMIIDVTGY